MAFKGNLKGHPGGGGPVFGSPGYKPAPKAPKMPFDFSGIGSGGGGGAPRPDMSSFRGTPSKWMEDIFNKAKDLAANAPDMLQRNLTAARDIGTSAMKEYQTGLTSRLGAGATAPGAAARISRETAMNMNKGALDAQNQQFQQQLGAYSLAGNMGSGISGDLRGQENAAINAYQAANNAWIAQQRIGLDAQIAAMNAMLGFYTPWMNAMGSGGGYGNNYGSGFPYGGGGGGGGGKFGGRRLG